MADTEKPESKKDQKDDFRGIVRVANKDIKGELSLPRALKQIKGIGFSLAEIISEIAAKELNIDRMEKIGNFNASQIKKLEDIIMNPNNYGIPAWMVDRQGGLSTEEVKHLVSSDLDFQKKRDIELQQNIRSYRGVRHMFGLRVRGQRTRTTGRKGTTLGVVRKKTQPQKTGKKETKGGDKGKKKKK